METKELWAFLIFGLRSVFCFHTVFYEYHFINTAMTWPDAQQYCRLHYSDLATFTSMEDIQKVKRVSYYIDAWIGLSDDPASWKGVLGNDSNSWRWTATGTSLRGFQAWEENEPDFYSADNACVMMRNGLWADASCTTFSTYFLCFTGSLQPGSKEFILIESYHTWSYALAYCRTHHVDLAVIEDASDLNTVSNLIGTYWVWIGLSREPFRWSDNRISHFKHWYPREPDNKWVSEHCVMESAQAAHGWLDALCTLELPVICQRALKTRTTLVKMELHTAADLTDPAINAQTMDKVSAMFTNLGLVDIKVSWKMSPVKRVMSRRTPVHC